MLQARGTEQSPARSIADPQDAVNRPVPSCHVLLEAEWNEPKHPRVAIVGKGVCFNSDEHDLDGIAAAN